MKKINIKKQEKIQRNEQILFNKHKKEYDSFELSREILNKLSLEKKNEYIHKKFKKLYKKDVPDNCCQTCLENSIYDEGHITDEEIESIMNN